MTEQMQTGWESLAKMFNTNVRRMMRHRKELTECGAIFYRVERIPGTYKRHRVVCWFESVMKNWAIMKGVKKERF